MEDATTGGSATVRAGVFNDGLLTLAPPAPIGITVTTASDAVFLVLPQPALIAVVKQFKARHQTPLVAQRKTFASALTWLAWLVVRRGLSSTWWTARAGRTRALPR